MHDRKEVLEEKEAQGSTQVVHNMQEVKEMWKVQETQNLGSRK